MKYTMKKVIEIRDEDILRLADRFEEKVNEAIQEIEMDMEGELMDIVAGVLPVDGDDDEVMENAFELLLEIQNTLFIQVLKRWNWQQNK